MESPKRLVLSPTLFNTFINIMEENTESLLIKFADDRGRWTGKCQGQAT